MCTVDLANASVYVGTYRKYNEGSLFGAWLNISDYFDKDDFLAACFALHADEPEAELMFQGWENIPAGLIDESWISEALFDIESQLDAHRIDNDAFFRFVEYYGYDLDADTDAAIRAFEDKFQGAFESEEDFAEMMLGECYELLDFALRYFDYERFARDLFMDGYIFFDGYVFSEY